MKPPSWAFGTPGRDQEIGAGSHAVRCYQSACLGSAAVVVRDACGGLVSCLDDEPAGYSHRKQRRASRLKATA
jgi:hypothetical protein